MSNAIPAPLSDLYSFTAPVEQSAVFSLSDCFPSKISVAFQEVKVGRRIFQLNRPLELLLERVVGGWSCEEPVLELFGFGEKSAEAVCSVFQDFSVLWDEIAQAPDDILSEGAQHAKRDLIAFVKSVSEV